MEEIIEDQTQGNKMAKARWEKAKMKEDVIKVNVVQEP